MRATQTLFLESTKGSEKNTGYDSLRDREGFKKQLAEFKKNLTQISRIDAENSTPR